MRRLIASTALRLISLLVITGVVLLFGGDIDDVASLAKLLVVFGVAT